jgi:predicted aminopeptidase
MLKYLLSCLFVFPLCSCYYIHQGSMLLKYQCRSVSNKSMLADPATPADLRKFLLDVEEIRRFAVDSAGLAENGNFSRFVRIERDYLIDNVYAARADTFVQYLWHYPFLGAMPYKGFFNRDGAEKEAACLRKKGYDVAIGRIDGFSSLGMLRDPVYSFMQRYGPYSLANMIGHESTHATIFIKNQSPFNEETATFIGRETGLRFIAYRYGKNSEWFKRANAFIEDEKTYSSLLTGLFRTLDTIYRSGRPREVRIALKNEAIDRFKAFVAGRYDSLFITKNYAGIASAVINNASLMIAMTYSRDLDIYYDLYRQCGNDLRKTVEALVALQGMKGDPKENLRAMLRK